MNRNVYTGNRLKPLPLWLGCFVLLLLLAALPSRLAGESQAPLPAQPLLTVSVAVEESSWTGKVQQRTVGGETVFVLETEGESYRLIPQSNLANLSGKNVTVKGTLQDGIITVTSIEEVR